MTHSIRLRGPWEFAVIGTEVSGRIEFPCDWTGLLSASGSASRPSPDVAEHAPIRLRRHFHLPTGLAPEDSVLLVVRCVSPQVTARLNGEELRFSEQSKGLWQANVTDRLAARNELTIEMPVPSPALADAGQPVLEAALEIHPAR